MTFSIHGLAISRGVAIGRAVLVASSRMEVAHYFIRQADVEAEIERVRAARNQVVEELQRLHLSISQMSPKDAPHELGALLDVHSMLLQDAELATGVKRWIVERLYNAEWALTAQLDVIARNFDEMEDPYLRERKGDLEQIAERILRAMRGVANPVAVPPRSTPKNATQDLMLGDTVDVPLVLVAHDLSPADMLQFKQSVFAGFITDVGGKTSHTAIVARSMDIPAVVGARICSQLVRQDDWIIIDGDAGVVIVDPSPIILAEYSFKKRQVELERGRLSRLLNTPAVTLDGEKIQLLANIEMPEDAQVALKAGALGVGLFRSEFLFMGRGDLPTEQEQFEAYLSVVTTMQHRPVTIRTLDLGADKTLDGEATVATNPALGLRAIRYCLAHPELFATQLRAILRASAHGTVRILIPMVAHMHEVHATRAAIASAKRELDERGQAYDDDLLVGAMVEVPATAIAIEPFAEALDFLSIGTNDLIQYTLAIDRADNEVAALYDPLHPAVLRLIANTINAGERLGKPVAVCGEMAGDSQLTRLLLGLGLKNFSMQAQQLLDVKREIRGAHSNALRLKVANALNRASEIDPATLYH